MACRKHLNSPTWQLAVATFKMRWGRPWRRMMIEWIGGGDPRAVFDVCDETAIAAAEALLRAFVEKSEIDFTEIHAREVAAVAAAKAALVAAAEERENAALMALIEADRQAGLDDDEWIENWFYEYLVEHRHQLIHGLPERKVV